MGPSPARAPRSPLVKPLCAARLVLVLRAGGPARFGSWGSAAVVALMGGCVQASQTYALITRTAANADSRLEGSVQIERIEGDDRLFVLRLDGLPPPESFGPEYKQFAAWVQDLRGRTVKLGVLSYDRPGRSGSLLGTARNLEFLAFTVRVTAERDASTSSPSRLLLAERHVTHQ